MADLRPGTAAGDPDRGMRLIQDVRRLHGERHGQHSAEERASQFIDWCALHGFGCEGWPAGAYEQLVAHIRRGERPFPLKD